MADSSPMSKPRRPALLLSADAVVDNVLLDRLAKADRAGSLHTNSYGADAWLAASLTASPFNSQPGVRCRRLIGRGSVQWGPSDTYQATGDLVLIAVTAGRGPPC